MKVSSLVLLLTAALLLGKVSAFGDTGDDFYHGGIAKAKEGDVDGALSDLDKAIELKPDQATCYLARALVRKSKNDLKGAIIDLTRAIELDPSYSPAYDSRGILEAKLRELDEALQCKDL
jgi:tetratricopeptide (TPR) repeat protein